MDKKIYEVFKMQKAIQNIKQNIHEISGRTPMKFQQTKQNEIHEAILKDMTKETKFDIGEEVYLKTCPDQFVRIITSIIKTPNGFMYELTIGEASTTHFDIEITREKQII